MPIRRFLVAFALSALSVSAQIVVQDASPGGPAGSALRASEVRESFDGTSVTFINFQTRDRNFRYTPPAGWESRIGAERCSFTKGNCHLSVALVEINQTSDRRAGEPTREELACLAQETAGKAPALDRHVFEPTELPFKIARQPVTEVTVTYGFAGRLFVLERIRSWGNDWRLEAEITGPKEEFDKVRSEIAQSLCSIELRTGQERELEMAKKEQEALDKIIAEQKSPSPHPVGTKIRGRIP